MDLSFDLKTRPLRWGIIDIGSNSIKSLVSETLTVSVEIFDDTEETRLSGGITGNPPFIGEATIQAGVASVEALLQGMEAYAGAHPVGRHKCCACCESG